ncbi:MAG: hypothetical protein ACM3XZ_08130 [Betaproteobacteria bacterium]
MRRVPPAACLAGTVLLATGFLLGGQPAWAESTDPSGAAVVTYTSGEVSVDEAGEYTITPSSSLGIQFSRQGKPPLPGLPGVGYEGYLSLGSSPATKAGLTLELDWEPPRGILAGRRYSLNTSLSRRWPDGPGCLPEEAWEVDAVAKEKGLGAASLEAGGRTGAHLNRLAGSDYWESAAYLATRFALDGEPGGVEWIEPAWLRDFASLLTPPPEPGAEERGDLPYWYESAALPGLPPLPPPKPFATAAEPRLARLVVTTRHAQTWRTYAGNSPDSWEAGETRLNVREELTWGEVAATFTNTVKLYPADSARTYRLAEGELEVKGLIGPGRGLVATSFRQRIPWTGTSEAYRQGGVSLGYALPGTQVDWRFSGEWRQRRYETQPEDDYSRTSLEAEVSWPAVLKTGGPAASAAIAATEERPLGCTRPTEYRLRLRLRGELPVRSGQTLSAGLAWERDLSAAPGGALVSGSTETLFCLSWKWPF